MIGGNGETLIAEMARISVIIPVYNGAPTIGELAERLEKSLESICEEFEVIMVNDGSLDDSWTEIKKLCKRHKWLTGIDLMKNVGQHNALLCGIRSARYNYTVTMDDDLQHPPEEIQKMLKKLLEGFDVVYGIDPGINHSAFRSLASRGLKFLLSTTMNEPSLGKISAFRIFRTRLRESFDSFSGEAVCIDALLTWGARKSGYVPVKICRRLNGSSNYRTATLFRQAVNIFLAFQAFPLKLMSMIGLFFVMVGVALLCFILTNYFLHGSVVPGFAFLGSIIVLFSGVQLLSLCVMGEYVSRIYASVAKRPPYCINEIKRDHIP